MSRRRNDWAERLARYLSTAARRRFEWGEHDCALFAAGAIQALREVDVANDLRTYRSEHGAARVLAANDCDGVEQIADKIAAEYGFEEIPVLRAQRGDVVVADLEAGPTLGVVDMTGRRAVFAAEKGLAHLELRYCRRAWRI